MTAWFLGICDDCLAQVPDEIVTQVLFVTEAGQAHPISSAPSGVMGHVVRNSYVASGPIPAKEDVTFVPELMSRLCADHLEMWRHEKQWCYPADEHERI
jgi:hypothetical protein